MPRDVISPTSSGLKAQTGKLTSSLSNRITRKLIGAELEQLFLEKFKFTLGSELVTNGTFDTDSDDWTKGTGWTIGSGVATHASGTASEIDQSFNFQSGKTYRITCEVSTLSGGTGSLQARGNGSTASFNLNTTGSFSFTYTDTTNHNTLRIYAGSGTTMVIDNVSVKEITKQAPVAAFSLRKLGDVSPYACRIRRSSDNTEAQVFFDASDRVSESSVVRNTSQNLLDYSEDFGQWTPLGSMTVSSASDITDPFGGTNSTKIVAPTGAGLKLLGPATVPTVSSGTTVTASLYVKNAGGRYVIFYLNDSSSRMLRVDLQTGTITSNTADSGTIEALDDDWYRISFTRTLDTNLGGVFVCPSLDGANVSFEGNGTDGVYIFGAQLEETVTYESTGTEKITNGDFSNGLTGWSENNGDVGGGSITVTNEEARIITSSDSSNFISIFRSVNWTANKKYKINFDVTINSATTGNGGLSVVAGTSGTTNYNLTGSGGSTTLTAGVLSSQTIEVVYPSTNSNSLVFKRRGAGDVNDFTIDNISVLEYDPIPSEYISTPVVSNDGLTFTETTLDDFVGGENLLTYNEDFLHGSWDGSFGSTTTASNITDPFGGTGAYLVTENSANSQHALVRNTRPTLLAGTHTHSCYVKSNGRNVVRLWNNGTSGAAGASFDLTTGQFALFSNATSASIDTLSDGWYRISLTFTNVTGNTGPSIYSMPSLTGSSHYQGDGTSGFYLFGFQTNTNSLKDYQKTSGSARDGNAGIVVLYNQTGGEDAIQETPAEQPLLYKEGLLVRSGSSPAWYYREKSSGNNDNLSIPSLTGLSRLDAFFVQENGSDTSFTYPTGASISHWGFAAASGSGTLNLQNFESTDRALLFTNGTQGSPANRGEVYTLLNGRKLVHFQNASTASWTSFNMSDYDLQGTHSRNLDDFKFSEWIFFDTNQSANRVSIEKDINDFHNLF